MELWNVFEQEKIYEFACKSDIECVVQSPVIDIVAIGCSDGTIRLINLLYDEVLFTFTQREGAISNISFLTDSALGLSLIASTSHQSGNIVLWDLNSKKIWSQMERPHAGRAISSLEFIPNEPVLASVSEDDNSIKMWLFEKG